MQRRNWGVLGGRGGGSSSRPPGAHSERVSSGTQRDREPFKGLPAPSSSAPFAPHASPLPPPSAAREPPSSSFSSASPSESAASAAPAASPSPSPSTPLQTSSWRPPPASSSFSSAAPSESLRGARPAGALPRDLEASDSARAAPAAGDSSSSFAGVSVWLSTAEAGAALSPPVSEASSQNASASQTLPASLSTFRAPGASAPEPADACNSHPSPPPEAPWSGSTGVLPAFSEAVWEIASHAKSPWTAAAHASLDGLSLEASATSFLRFLLASPPHLYVLGLFVSSAADVGLREEIFEPLTLSSCVPGHAAAAPLLSESSAAFWKSVFYDPQHRSLHEMFSTVPFELDVLELLHFAPMLGAALLNRPRETLALFEERLLPDVAQRLLLHLQARARFTRRRGETASQALASAAAQSAPEARACREAEEESEEDLRRQEEEKLLLQTAPQLKVRLTHLPRDRYIERRTPLQIHTSDEGKLICITGRVARAGDLQAVEEERAMSCRQCGQSFRVFACAETGYQLDIPLQCPAGSAAIRENLRRAGEETFESQGRKQGSRGRGGGGFAGGSRWRGGRRTGPCEGETFDSLGEGACLMDYQEIKLRCTLSGARKYLSRDPAHRALLPVVLLRDLAGTVSLGDVITVVGVVGRRWQRIVRDTRADVELVLEANNVFRIRPDPLAAARHSAALLFQDPLLARSFLSQARARRRRALREADATAAFPSSPHRAAPASARPAPPREPLAPVSGSALFAASRGASSPAKRRGKKEKLPALPEIFDAFWESTGRDAVSGERLEAGATRGSDPAPWDEWAARSKLVDAACPALYGAAPAKLAILLTIISGCMAKTVPQGGFGDPSALAAASFSPDAGATSAAAEEETGSRWKKFVASASSTQQKEEDIWSPPSSRAAYLFWGEAKSELKSAKDEEREALEAAKGDAATRKTRRIEGGSDGNAGAHTGATHEGGCGCDGEEAVRKRKGDEEKGSGGCDTRHKCHLLLVGGTGTGKSMLLLAGKQLAQKAYAATGVGCSAAGLTCAAVRDPTNGAWHLDPGLLVLASDGVCCLDDLYLMKKDAQAAIHEAMEQQSISVAKAGLVTRLTARCSIIAASTTEKGAVAGSRGVSAVPLARLFGAPSSGAAQARYDDLPCLDANMPPPLFSRFDSVVVLGDAPGATEAVTDFLVQRAVGRRQRAGASAAQEVAKTSSVPSSGSSPAPLHSSASPPPFGLILPWTTSLLRMYLAFATNSFFPGLSRQAGQILSRYYVRLREVGSEKPREPHGEGDGGDEGLAALSSYLGGEVACAGGGTGVTVRFFEGLFRLTQAHARLMARHEARRRDAVAVIWMLETALCGNRIVPGLKKKSSEGVPAGRHGLLHLADPSTAAVVDLLCLLPRQPDSSAALAASPSYVSSSSSPLSSSFPSSVGSNPRVGVEGAGGAGEPARQLVYSSLQSVAGKALHCDIRSEAQYLAVEKLVLKALQLTK